MDEKTDMRPLPRIRDQAPALEMDIFREKLVLEGVNGER